MSTNKVALYAAYNIKPEQTVWRVYQKVVDKSTVRKR